MKEGMEERINTSNGGRDEPDYVDDGISLRPYLEILRSYRRVIGAGLLAVGALFIVGTLLVFLIAPVERTGSIQFRLLFDGAEKGEYPNGTPFSTSEIVGTPVLTEVFQANDLQRFGKYEDFKATLFVQQSNTELDFLEFEYQGLLADTKLSPVDRARIQDEFRKKREEMTDPAYVISMRRDERLVTLPRNLMEKILLDTLNTWAKQAEERKGATRYNVSVLSTDILQKEILSREDYLVAIDILRAKTNRVLETLRRIARIPGAESIRIGEKRISMAEIRAGLEDVIRFKLEPLSGLIRSEGVTKNARQLSLYAANQLFQLRLEKQEAAERISGIQTALGEFRPQRVLAASGAPVGSGATGGGGTSQGVVAQMDQSFMDQLMELSTAQADSEYRRELTDRIVLETDRLATMNRDAAYYEDLVAELRNAGGRVRLGSPESVKLIETRSAEAFQEVARGIELTAALYRELSALNLNPSSTVFTLTGPFKLDSARAVTAPTILLYFAVIMMLSLIALPVGCLVHHSLKRQD